MYSLSQGSTAAIQWAILALNSRTMKAAVALPILRGSGPGPPFDLVARGNAITLYSISIRKGDFYSKKWKKSPNDSTYNNFLARKEPGSTGENSISCSSWEKRLRVLWTLRSTQQDKWEYFLKKCGLTFLRSFFSLSNHLYHKGQLK